MSSDEFDEGALAELREDLGDAFADFASRFRSGARGELEAASADLERGDGEAAAARAHALKGTAGYLGAIGLVDCLGRLQRAASSGDHSSARSAVSEALDALAKLESHIGL